MAGVRKKLGSLLGPKGTKGDQGIRGFQGVPGAEGLPTGAAIAEHVVLPGAARDALSNNFVQYAPPPIGGGADDVPNLVEALASLPVGGALRLHSGTYQWGSRFTINKAVELIGAGKSRTIINHTVDRPMRAGASGVAIRALTVTNTMTGSMPRLFDDTLTSGAYGGWRFEDVLLDGTALQFRRIGGTSLVGTNTTGTGHDGDDHQVIRCEIKNVRTQYALEISGLLVTVDKSWIHHNGSTDSARGEGIKVLDLGGLHLTSSKIEYNWRDGIDLYSAKAATVTGNTIRHNKVRGIEAKWFTTDPAPFLGSRIIVADNLIYGNEGGGISAGAHNVTVEGNHFWDNGFIGIAGGSAQDNTAAATTGLIVKGNRVEGGAHCISLDNGAVDGAVVEGNIVSGATGDGIRMGADTTHSTVGLNRAFGNSGRGIREAGVSNTVANNSTTDGTGFGNHRTAHKTVTTARSNTTTLELDPHLTFTWLPAGSVWTIQALLFVQATSEVPDMRIRFSIPSGSTGRYNVLAGSSSATSWGAATLLTGVDIGSTTTVGLDDAAYGALRVEGSIKVGNEGTLALMWSQSVADASTVSVLDGSWLRLERAA